LAFVFEIYPPLTPLPKIIEFEYPPVLANEPIIIEDRPFVVLSTPSKYPDF